MKLNTKSTFLKFLNSKNIAKIKHEHHILQYAYIKIKLFAIYIFIFKKIKYIIFQLKIKY